MGNLKEKLEYDYGIGDRRETVYHFSYAEKLALVKEYLDHDVIIDALLESNVNNSDVIEELFTECVKPELD